MPQRTRLAFSSLRLGREQTTLLSRLTVQGANTGVGRKVIQQMYAYAYKDVIPRLQAEYVNNPPTENYVRQNHIFEGWRVNVNYSHGAIAVVFWNTARNPRTGWPYMQNVQGHHQREDIPNIARWKTIDQIVGSQRNNFIEKAQDAFDELVR